SGFGKESIRRLRRGGRLRDREGITGQESRQVTERGAGGQDGQGLGSHASHHSNLPPGSLVRGVGFAARERFRLGSDRNWLQESPPGSRGLSFNPEPSAVSHRWLRVKRTDG